MTQFGRRGQAAAHRALHRVRPAGIGPRAGQDQAGPGGRGLRPQRAAARCLAERRPPLAGDEELGDLGVARGREEFGQRGQELLAQLRGRGVRVLVRGRQRDGQVLLAWARRRSSTCT